MRKLTRITTLLIGGFLIAKTSHSQKNFLQGYVVTLTGDTVQGQIDYRNWDKNPTVISFKPTSGAEIIQYPATGIKKFRVLDEMYESAIVSAETSPYQIDQLDYEREVSFRTDTTFLQAIMDGTKSLYYYKDKNGKEHFYIKSGDVFELLVYKKYLRDEDGKDMIKQNQKYIDQLNLYLGECPSVRDRVFASEYKKRSLEKIFSRYYQCTNTGVSFTKKEKYVMEIGILAGVSSTELRFTSASDQFIYLSAADIKKSVNFSGGVFFDLILDRNQAKWSINNELFLSSYKVKGRYEDYESNDKYTYHDLALGYTYIKMNNMIRFKYPVGRQFVFINAGMSNGLAIKETNNRRRETKFYTSETVEEIKVLDDTRTYEQGYIVGLGTRVKQYSLEARYEQGNAMSAYKPLKGVSKRFSLLFGFRL